jgi:hypothetical protein
LHELARNTSDRKVHHVDVHRMDLNTSPMFVHWLGMRGVQLAFGIDELERIAPWTWF